MPWILTWALAAWLAAGCSGSHGPESSVTLYTSQDRIYAEPLLKRFEQSTGIRVRTVFDSEAVKTVGLANRLRAERSHPRCDVFWSNESHRAFELASQGILAEFKGSHTACRHRALVINTNLVARHQAPRFLASLTNTEWQGRLALAYPLFGTTGAHLLAARTAMGDAGWRAWASTLAAQKPLVLDGNSMVVKMVGLGRAAAGLTDSDDIRAGQREGLPVGEVPIEDVPMKLRAFVGIVSGRPESPAARRLADFLGGEEVARALVASGGFDEVESNEPSRTVAVLAASTVRPTGADATSGMDFLRQLFTR